MYERIAWVKMPLVKTSALLILTFGSHSTHHIIIAVVTDSRLWGVVFETVSRLHATHSSPATPGPYQSIFQSVEWLLGLSVPVCNFTLYIPTDLIHASVATRQNSYVAAMPPQFTSCESFSSIMLSLISRNYAVNQNFTKCKDCATSIRWHAIPNDPLSRKSKLYPLLCMPTARAATRE